MNDDFDRDVQEMLAVTFILVVAIIVIGLVGLVYHPAHDLIKWISMHIGGK